MAHRGGAQHPDLRRPGEHPARLPARGALGYHYLETDVHLTSDGVLLAFHDDVLDRVTDGSGRLLAETAVRRPGAARASAGAHPIPRMADLLEEFPDVRFNIDLKSDGGRRRAGRPARAHRRPRPGLRRVLLRAPAARVPHGSSADGWPPRTAPARGRPCAGSPRGASPPCCWRGRGSMRSRCRTGDPRSGRVVTRAFVRRAHAAGPHVHVWTVDEPAEMDELLDLGVDGLITDRTDVLKDVLIERGQWGRAERGHEQHRARDRRPGAAGPAPAAEGLELVRLGQLGLLHDRAQRDVRAVHDHRRREGPPAASTPTRPAPAPSTCSACTWRPARCRAT